MNTLGGFNELYNPFYHEDVDYRARAYGAQAINSIMSIQQYAITDMSTIGKEKKSRVRATAQRNKIMLHYLHLPRIEWYTFLFIYVIKKLAVAGVAKTPLPEKSNKSFFQYFPM